MKYSIFIITNVYSYGSSSSSATEDEPLATALISGVQPEQVGNACWDPLARKGKGLKNSSSKKGKDSSMLNPFVIFVCVCDLGETK